MQKQKETELLIAFRTMSPCDREMILNLAQARAVKQEFVQPILRLVSDNNFLWPTE